MPAAEGRLPCASGLAHVPPVRSMHAGRNHRASGKEGASKSLPDAARQADGEGGGGGAHSLG